MVGRVRGGFTLVEAVVSLLISSALVALIGTVFIVQTDFYETQLQRTAAQDNARGVTDLISMELRTAMVGGVLVANDTQLVVRSPMRLAIVCEYSNNFSHVFYDGGEGKLDKAEMVGIGVYNDTTGTWSYHPTTYDNINAQGENPQQKCASMGADTVGAWSSYNTLFRLKQVTGNSGPMGQLLMFYRETEFVLTESTLQPGTIGLYRGSYGGELVEFASGMDPTAQFLYRTGGTSYSSPVGSMWLSTIDAVRLVATTRIRASGGGKDDVTAGWSVNVPLRNAN